MPKKLTRDNFFTQANERVGIFIDQTSFDMCIASLGRKFDYNRLDETIHNQAMLKTSRYYVFLNKNADEDDEQKKLSQRLAFGPFFYVISEFVTYTKNRDGVFGPHYRSMDTRIVADMITLVDELDHIIYLGASKDVIPAILAVRSKGVRFTTVGTALSPYEVTTVNSQGRKVNVDYKPITPPTLRATSDAFVELAHLSESSLIQRYDR